MELQILTAFLFFSLVLLGYAFYNKRVIYLAPIASLLLLVLGASVLSQGIGITYAGSYGFVANNTTDMIGISTTTETFKDVYTDAEGIFLVIFGILTFFLSIYFLSKGSGEE